MNYRPEIDGLRAISVISVIFFHAGFETFSGGFVGVDIFFVISGYLITYIIITELEKGSFSYISFYEGRARRILPALFLLMLISIPFAWYLLLPLEMKYFSQSLVAASLFTSNILFYLQTGYFDPTAELKPLIHTWSLATEQQFYIVFPILLTISWKLGQRWILRVLGVTFILSLGIAQYTIDKSLSGSFYLLPSRFFEFLVGSFSALYLYKNNQIEFIEKFKQFGSFIGIALIICSILLFNNQIPFPSFYTLIPALGTLLIILFATQKTITGKILGNKVLVGIGLVSYSAYLYHQPLFAFARHRIIFDPTKTLFFLLSIFVFVLAYLSWYFIESPFRNKNQFSRFSIFIGSILIITFFVLFGLWGHSNNGFYELRINQFKQISTIQGIDKSRCHLQYINNVNDLKNGNFCTIGTGDPTMAIVGDSHAGALFIYADEYLKSLSISSLAVTGSACAPILNGFEARENCKEVIHAAFDKIVNNPKIKKVILVAKWNMYSTGMLDNKRKSLMRDNEGKAANSNDNLIIFRRSLLKTIQYLEDYNKEIIIVYPVPTFSLNANSFIQKQNRFNDIPVTIAADLLPKITTENYREQNSTVFSVFNEVKHRVRFFEVDNILCPDQFCYQSRNSLPLYSDTDHLNLIGAKMLVPQLFTFILSNPAEK